MQMLGIAGAITEVAQSSQLMRQYQFEIRWRVIKSLTA